MSSRESTMEEQILEVKCVDGVVRGNDFEITVIESENHLLASIELEAVMYQFIDGKSIQLIVPLNIAISPNDNTGKITIPFTKNMLPIKSLGIKLKGNEEVKIVYGENWFLGNLFVSSKDEFENQIKSEKTRVGDQETLLFISQQNMLYGTYDICHQIASFVIYCYKCIEQNKFKELKLNYDRFAYFIQEKNHYINRRGNVREDGRQLLLSLLTVKWQVEIYLKKYKMVEQTLSQIIIQPEEHDYFKPSLTLNYGNACVFLGYIQHKQGFQDLAVITWTQLYLYYRNLMTTLPEQPTIPPAHFEDMIKCSNAVYLALRGIKQYEKRNDSSISLKDYKVFELVNRVPNSELFREKFYEYLKWCTANRPNKERKQMEVGIVSRDSKDRKLTLIDRITTKLLGKS